MHHVRRYARTDLHFNVVAAFFSPSMHDALTDRQQEIYRFIQFFVRTEGTPPTVREIGDGVGLASSSAVHYHLRALTEKGFLTRESRKSRGITLSGKATSSAVGDSCIQLPVVSRGEAGGKRVKPEAMLWVDRYLLRRATSPERCLCMRAADDGMAGAGIYRGDLVLVERVRLKELDSGATVGAITNNRCLVRRYEYDDGRHVLKPASRHHSTQSFSPESSDVHPLGRVIGVLRRV